MRDGPRRPLDSQPCAAGMARTKSTARSRRWWSSLQGRDAADGFWPLLASYRPIVRVLVGDRFKSLLNLNNTEGGVSYQRDQCRADLSTRGKAACEPPCRSGVVVSDLRSKRPDHARHWFQSALISHGNFWCTLPDISRVPRFTGRRVAVHEDINLGGWTAVGKMLSPVTTFTLYLD